MRFDPRPEETSSERPSARSALRTCRLAAMALGVWSVALAPVVGEERWLLKGLLDAEVWKTDSGSRLLSKNEGDPAPEGRLRLWAAGEFTPGLQGFALGYLESGKADDEEQTQTEIEQAFLRYSFKPELRLVLEAGKIPMPVGNFARRYLSSVNPLIGSPDTYDVTYPLGLQLTGSVSWFDYRAAVIDLPPTNDKYVPEAGSSPRPALAAGITPLIGLRLGAYLTRGPYLNRDLEPLLPAGTGWKDYRENVSGFDLQFSRGYFELNGEYVRSSYEVPTHDVSGRGKAYYLEPKYTWSPRFFTALRLERNDYIYILPISSAFWVAQAANLYDIEAGVGYRIGADAIIKVAYRKDRWSVEESLKSILPNGHSLAVQFSYSFDVRSWIERPK